VKEIGGNMRISENRFSKWDYIDKLPDNEQRYCGYGYSYESTKALYDVMVLQLDVNTQKISYRVNMQPSEKTAHHEVIEKYYNLKG
jgi:hypothetical protein